MASIKNFNFIPVTLIPVAIRISMNSVVIIHTMNIEKYIHTQRNHQENLNIITDLFKVKYLLRSNSVIMNLIYTVQYLEVMSEWEHLPSMWKVSLLTTFLD